MQKRWRCCVRRSWGRSIGVLRLGWGASLCLPLFPLVGAYLICSMIDDPAIERHHDVCRRRARLLNLSAGGDIIGPTPSALKMYERLYRMRGGKPCLSRLSKMGKPRQKPSCKNKEACGHFYRFCSLNSPGEAKTSMLRRWMVLLC